MSFNFILSRKVKSRLCLIGFLSIFNLNAQDKLTDLVDVFIGTGGHGHTFPHAMVPFGAVSAGPDWATLGWDAAGGYHYDATNIKGFSQVHLSGTGLTELGDLLLVPTIGKIKIAPGSYENPDEGYRSRISHEDENARPGYYQVRLLDYNINAEMTASTRVGFHKYTFPKSEDAHIILDLTHHINGKPGSVKHSYIKIQDKQTVLGYRYTSGVWAPNRQLYFAMKFSKPFVSRFIWDGNKGAYNDKKSRYWDLTERGSDQLKGVFNFNTKEGEVIYVKIAVSSVSMNNALENLEGEIPHWDFNKVVRQADEKWENELQKIHVKGTNERVRKFYAALYHNNIHPTVNHDLNGDYRGIDQEVHNTEDYTHYTVFSLWDTFRATHPLFTLIHPKRTDDIVKTMIDFQKQSPMHMLPMWSMYQNENTCMIGLHSFPVIADAFFKGLTTVPEDEMLEAMIETSNNPGIDSTAGRAIYPAYYGQKYYLDKGYHPNDVVRTGVSVTLEHSYDDWALALAASKMGREDVKETYLKRSQNYNNVWDKETKFFRAKMNNGEFKEPFDPRAYHREDFHDRDYTEGNAWQYLWFVPHDIYGLMSKLGGKKEMEKKLDTLFNLPYLGESSVGDVSGLIGDYAHGNEPCHHVAYLYNYTGQPWKTQERVHQIDREFYKDEPNGYIGNEDAGQMSAWYVFSAMGFYPVNPAGGVYIFGSPLLENVILNLSDGKKFEISAKNLSEENIYIQSVKLNGKSYNNVWITHDTITKGGTLEFIMGPEPNGWGKDSKKVPFGNGKV
ncbi:glycoside hydrolase family 92 protein [Galbibacter sp. BG1]|uniref:GH92 family glycosyl hydrolase n=1 Tax=Galbibacter sp. BG1 TaxID=1170699 RepID=UPI0015BCD417|nr:GH92 family glycosyl hydrolase [Galbibacter sp. BG1]QLE02453.1 glycoside hydrolase family 92 protein [Galbibacter sp. BG1]